MNRADFQALAERYIDDAAVLLAGGRWSGAYYNVGYAVECALKACVAKLTGQYDFPDRDRAVKAFTHKPEPLVELTGLKLLRDAEKAADPAFELNWSLILAWNEATRYGTWAEAEARELFEAVADPHHGVLQWIKRHW